MEEALTLPLGYVEGTLTAEAVLPEILRGVRRIVGDPRPGPLPWTDKFPPPPDPTNPEGLAVPPNANPPPPNTPVNQLVLDAMSETSDLSKPHVISHRFYFAKRADAMALKKELTKRKFQGEPIRNLESGDKPFVLVAHHLMVPDFDALEEEGERLRALAEKHGGEYDGWESGIVPPDTH